MASLRSSGVLLHPTSLPGPYGIGDLGAGAHQWVDWLAGAGQRLWQILPLGPTGYGDSPYQCFSAFAGNPLLVSPDKLADDGLLTPDDLRGAPPFPAERVDYGPVIEYKNALWGAAFRHFQRGRAPALNAEFESFCAAHAAWLDDYALFMALKEAHGGAVWSAWERALAGRDAAALAQARQAHADAIASQKFRQFLFFRQWLPLKAYANAQGIRIIGDLPIFVAYDSADVWAHPELFYLDGEGRATVVAGVPPDYFSATGQLWGNPIYRWDVLKASGYAWWIERFGATLSLVDVVRLDHFRGFEAYWEIPAGRPTAEVGQWVEGPGADFLDAVRAGLGALPLIAEDLGVITPGVVALRDQFDLPGMKVLQFAFAADAADPFLPHNYSRNYVVYSGTHDNDTTLGWYQTATEKERDFCCRYLGRDPLAGASARDACACAAGAGISWDFIRLAWSSVADRAVAPLQDVLSLGPEARMNLPGSAGGNWGWRFTAGMLTDAVRSRLAEVTQLYGRAGDSASDETRARPGHGGGL